MREINFVRNRQKALGKQQRFDRKLLYFSLGGFGVVAIVSLIIIGVQFYFFSSFSKVEAQIKAFEQQVLSAEGKESTFVILVHKLQAINKVLTQRSVKEEAVKYFSTVFGDEVLIEELSYEGQGEDQLLTFTLVSQDVFVLEQVIDKLASTDLQAKYPEVVSSNLLRDNTGAYSLTVVVPLDKVKIET